MYVVYLESLGFYVLIGCLQWREYMDGERGLEKVTRSSEVVVA